MLIDIEDGKEEDLKFRYIEHLWANIW
jgi:hypothetical protein